jgi:hypothetical protein
MSKSLAHISGAAAAAGTRQTITAKRVRFVAVPFPGAKVLRVYRRPAPRFAIEEEISLSELPVARVWPEPFDELTVLVVPANTPASEFDEDWMGTPSHPDAPMTAVLACNAHRIQWRPGRAIIQGPVEGFETLLLALVDFAFYEGELRGLEKMLDDREEQAEADVGRAHRVRMRERQHWGRFSETITSFSRMRLNYARLESQVAAAMRVVPRQSRPVIARLNDEARIDDRLEAFSNRLEAFEDLYEGANDRFTEHRWYITSQWLEIGIVVILILEVVLIALGPYLWHLR